MEHGNFYGLIQQPKHFDLIAGAMDYKLIDNIKIISDYIDHKGAYIALSGNATSSQNFKYTSIGPFNSSDFDYVFLPVSSGGSSLFSGLTNALTPGGSFTRYWMNHNLNSELKLTYVLIPVNKADDNFYITCNLVNNDDKPPIILIKTKNVSEGLNHVNSNILQPVKKDELNGEADRIRDELPGNAESPDLDSKSGAGADERADS